MSDLDEFLDGEETPEVEAETPEQPEQPEEPKEEPKAEEPQMVPLAALQESRSDVQSLKAQISSLEQMVQAQNQPKPEPIPDVLEDQKGFVGAFQQQMHKMQAHMRAELSEAKARMQHGDDLVSEAFEAAKAAGMTQQFASQQDPWGALAKWHKDQKVAQEIGGDLDGYKAKLREEIKAELSAQMVAESVKAKAAQPAPTLAGQPNLGSRSAPAWTGPDTLDEILGG